MQIKIHDEFRHILDDAMNKQAVSVLNFSMSHVPDKVSLVANALNDATESVFTEDNFWGIPIKRVIESNVHTAGTYTYHRGSTYVTHFVS